MVLMFEFLFSKVYFYELKAIIIPFFELIGKLIEKLGLDNMENPLFWLQRHLFEIVENRLKNKVIFLKMLTIFKPCEISFSLHS
jgi:hypothetical protein